MRIIISPAKKMKEDTESLAAVGMPVFLTDAGQLCKWMQQLTYEAARALWKCNEKIAKLNYERFAHMDLMKNLTPAILSFEGIQYQYMAPAVFEDSQLAYVQKHLRILSGFYGVLKPMDGVMPYRLEMQAKAKPNGCTNLYEFWGRRLYEEIVDEERVIINLASKEYSTAIERYLQSEDTYITCIFGEYIEGTVKQKGTYAKMARGEMVRFMAENTIRKPEQLREFNRLGYEFSEKLSDAKRYVFVKNP